MCIWKLLLILAGDLAFTQYLAASIGKLGTTIGLGDALVLSDLFKA